MSQQFSPNMLKTFEQCPRKYEFRYLREISMPVNDEIFEFGKNIHALASYYLRGENIEKMENSLSIKEHDVWNYLKTTKYFGYKLIGAEYNLAVKINNYFYGGRIDALVYNGSEYFILDYKTGSIPKDPKFDFQTMIYILCVKENLKTENINFVYLDLRHREEFIIKYTSELAQEYIQRLNNVTTKIKSYDTIKRKDNCNCEYELICY